MCYHLKTRAGISEFNFLDSGFWAPQKVDKKSWPTVTKWSSATLYLRSSAPLAYIKRKRGRKQHEVTAKYKYWCLKRSICAFRFVFVTIERDVHVYRGTRLSFTDSAVSHHRVFPQKPRMEGEKRDIHLIAICHQILHTGPFNDHVGGCSLCHCWTVLRSTEWCFYYSGYPFFN